MSIQLCDATTRLIDENLSRVNDRTFKDKLKRRILKTMKAGVEDIRKLLAPEKYRLMFVGQVGSGKTTALCHLLGLTYKKKGGKNVEGDAELLMTGEGRVTICPVVIKPSSQPYIKIKPVPKAEFKEWLRELAEYAVGRARNDNNLPPAQSAGIQRALLNMTGYYLPPVDRHPQLIDEAIKIINRMEPVGDDLDEDDDPATEELFDILLQAANLPNRKITIFGYTGRENWTEQAEWLQSSFRAINVMLREDAPYPERIEIGIPNIRQDILRYFDEFIDTQGLESEHGQLSEIEKWLVEPETITVFCTPFANAPEPGIRAVLKYYLDQNPEHRKDQYLLMAAVRSGGAENITDGDGFAVGDFDDGCRIRIGQIINALGDIPLHVAQGEDEAYENGIRPNIFIYNAKRYLVRVGVAQTVISGRQGEKIRGNLPLWNRDANSPAGTDNADYSNFVFSKIIESVEARKRRLAEEVRKIRDEVESIDQMELLSTDEEAAIQQLVGAIKEITTPEPAFDKFFEWFDRTANAACYLEENPAGGFPEILVNIDLGLVYENGTYLRRRVPDDLATIIRKGGVHKPGAENKYDFYARSEAFTQELLVEPFKQVIAQLLERLGECKEQCANDFLTKILDERERLLTQSVDPYLAALKQRVREKVKELIGPDKWDEIRDIDQRPKTGARLALIMEMLDRDGEENSFNEFFNEQVEEVFKEIVIDPLVDFF